MGSEARKEPPIYADVCTQKHDDLAFHAGGQWGDPFPSYWQSLGMGGRTRQTALVYMSRAVDGQCHTHSGIAGSFMNALGSHAQEEPRAVEPLAASAKDLTFRGSQLFSREELEAAGHLLLQSLGQNCRAFP